MPQNNNHNIFKPAGIIEVSLEKTVDMPCFLKWAYNTVHLQLTAKYQSRNQQMESVENR